MRLTLLVLGALLASAATMVADQPAPVDRAVAQGVVFLKARQQPDDTWEHPTRAGMTGLAGYAPLEWGVPAKDPAVQKATDAVRRTLPSMTHIYSLALTMVFLDKLGKPEDEALIQAAGLRLSSGQFITDGWSYYCPPPSRSDVKALTKWLKEGPLATKRGRLLPDFRKAVEELARGPVLSGLSGDARQYPFCLVGIMDGCSAWDPCGNRGAPLLRDLL